MSLALPPKLRPDLQRFATRAAQLATHRPIITYWCEYHILQHVLQHQHHLSDPACAAYAAQLMDRLEATKAAHPATPALTDDAAAHAYVRAFARSTWTRADDAQRAGRADAAAADAFLAAAVFLEVLGIWDGWGEEERGMSRFAKFHAARILRALKKGEDPNASNPAVEGGEDPNASNPGVEEGGVTEGTERGTAYRPPRVDSVPNVSMTGTTPPPGDEAIPSPDETVEPAEAGHGDLPMDDALLSLAAPEDPTRPLPPAIPSIPTPSPSTTPHPAALPPSPPPRLPTPHRVPDEPMASTPATSSSAAPHPPPASAYRTDDEATLAAQKHARWAISALNFEDVPTAVRELRAALGSLGAG